MVTDKLCIIHLSLLQKKNLTNPENGGIIEIKGCGDEMKDNSQIKIDLQFFSEKDIENQESGSLKRAIRKYHSRISEHRDKIQNPRKYISGWDSLDEKRQTGLIKHWNKEIRNFEQSISDRIEELKKRGDYDE